MKKLLILIISLSSLIYAQPCEAIKTNKWVCKDFEKTSIITLYNNTYWIKSYFPYQKNKQTEAVYVTKSTPENFKEQYLTNCRLFRMKHTDIQWSESDDICNIDWSDFISQNYSRIIVLAFLSDIMGKTPVHAVYCMAHNYVRTYDIDEYTKLEINRKDYDNLPTRNYCTEFLSSNKVRFIP